MVRISRVSKPSGRHLGLILATSLGVALLSTGAFAGSVKANASQASMGATQSAVRDARDQVQRRLWAQQRWHQR